MLPAGAGVRWQRDNRLRSFGQDGNWATGEKTLMDRQEEEFAAIVERIGDVEHRWYRRRIVAASSALVIGAAIVGWSWAIWGSAWGAAVGLPLMAGADLAWIGILRRRRRWRRSPGPIR